MNSLGVSEVLKRSRVDSLDRVRHLNCWGANLAEVSVLQQLPSLEVLNISCNSVTTLRDLRHCPHLSELYARRNCLSSLDELDHLAPLQQLRVLWISDNPLTAEPGYRLAVIRQLPQITKLDNQLVTDEERLKACSTPSTSGNVLRAVLCLLMELDREELADVERRAAQLKQRTA